MYVALISLLFISLITISRARSTPPRLLKMASRLIFCLLLLLTHFLPSGLSMRTMKESHVISTTQKDITTPITTIPTLVPIISSPSSPSSSSSSSPILNPNSSPDSVSPASTLPYTTINTPTIPNNNNSSVSSSSPSSSSSSSATPGVSWCVASPSASQISLQVALDYACGYGGADCSEIQPNGRCYNPISLRDQASFAFNSYYHKNPLPNSCNFGGVAVITSTNPSFGPCQYPSISTSTSVLNTTNSMGANVFGSVPVPMNPSPSAAPSNLISFSFLHVILTIFLLPFLSNIFSL